MNHEQKVQQMKRLSAMRDFFLDSLTLKEGNDRFSRNFSKELPLLAA
jgi:hypothetical protein